MLHFTHLGTNQVRGSWHRGRSLAWNVSLSKIVILLLFLFLFACSEGLGRWVPERVADYISQSHCFAWFCDECKSILIVMNVILFCSKRPPWRRHRSRETWGCEAGTSEGAAHWRLLQVLFIKQEQSKTAHWRLLQVIIFKQQLSNVIVDNRGLLWKYKFDL